MEGIRQNIKQLLHLFSTTIHSAILKTMSHYIRSALPNCWCLPDLFSSVRDNQDAGTYFRSHSIPFRAVKAKASLLKHKTVEAGSLSSCLKQGHQEEPAEAIQWLGCVYPEMENAQLSWVICSLICVSPAAFIQSKSFTEVTRIFTCSPTDLRWENMMTASHFEVVSSQLDRQHSLRHIYYWQNTGTNWQH